MELNLARYSRYLGVLSSVVIMGALVFWGFRLGVRDAREVPVIKPLITEIRTEAKDTDTQKGVDYQGLEVNKLVEGAEQVLPKDLALAPEGGALDQVDPAIPTATPPEVPANPATSQSTEEAPVQRPADLPDKPLAITENQPAPESVAPPQNETIQPPAQTANNTDLGPRLPKGTPVVQLASDPDMQRIQKIWAQIQNDHRDILGDKSLYLETTTVNGQIYYRLRVSGFPDHQATLATCGFLLDRGQECLAVPTEN